MTLRDASYDDDSDDDGDEPRSRYRCSACGKPHDRKTAYCPCGRWRTVEPVGAPRSALDHRNEHDTGERILIGVPALDTAYGGGVKATSCNILAGPAGTGKSRLIVAALKRFAGRTLYVTGEETIDDLIDLCHEFEFGKKHLAKFFPKEADTIEDALDEAAESFDLVVIDSMQAFETEGIDGRAGEPHVVFAVCHKTMLWSRDTGIPTFVISQETVAGGVAGGTKGPHAVTSVAHAEKGEDGIVRVKWRKNRGGKTHVKVRDHTGHVERRPVVFAYELTDTGIRVVHNECVLPRDRRDDD